MPEMKYHRITVGDNKVCDDCITYEDLPGMTMKEWDESGLKPRVAPTECNGKCRCGLVPSTMEDIQAEAERMIQEAVEEGFGQTVIDLTTGRRVLLSEFEQYEGMLTAQFKDIATMENLIYQWKVANDGVKLPKEFFELQDIYDMTRWLKRELNPTLAGKPGPAPITKEAIGQRLKDLGIEKIDLKGIDDIKVLSDIENQLNAFIKKGYTKNLNEIVVKIDGAYAWGTEGKLFLNPKHFKDYKELLKSRKRSCFDGYEVKLPEKDLIKAIITHEYAHNLTHLEIYYKKGLWEKLEAVHKGYKRRLSPITKKREKLLDDLYKKHFEALEKIDITDISAMDKEGTFFAKEFEKIESWYKNEIKDFYISGYANKNLTEFVAEAFTDYIHSSNPSPYSIKIGKIIDAKYKTGGK